MPQEKWIGEAMFFAGVAVLVLGIRIEGFSVSADRLWPKPFFTVPLRRAALMIYEAAERSGDLEMVSSPHQSESGKIAHLAFTILVANLRIYGRKPPSTRLRQIPPEEISQFHPHETRDWLISDFAADPSRWIDVRVSRRDLNRLMRRNKRIASADI